MSDERRASHADAAAYELYEWATSAGFETLPAVNARTVLTDRWRLIKELRHEQTVSAQWESIAKAAITEVDHLRAQVRGT